MAAFAVDPELAAVKICVAIGAMGADVMEHQRSVTLGAANFFMHAAKRIARLVVIEFRDSAYGLPTGVGVAVLTRDGERSMRIGHLGTRRRRLLLGRRGILLSGDARPRGRPKHTRCKRENDVIS